MVRGTHYRDVFYSGPHSNILNWKPNRGLGKLFVSYTTYVSISCLQYSNKFLAVLSLS